MRLHDQCMVLKAMGLNEMISGVNVTREKRSFEDFGHFNM